MDIGDEDPLGEEVTFKFNSGSVNGESEHLENLGDDLEEADPVASLDHECVGVTGIVVIDGDG